MASFSSFSFIGVENRKLPCEGPVAIPIQLDFSGSTPSYSINLLLQQQQTRISLVQTVWIDMSNSSNDMTVFIPQVNQTIVAKAGTQGYYPVLCPNPIEMVAAVATQGDINQMTLINVAIAGVVWSAA